jgi:hypothetical protein
MALDIHWTLTVEVPQLASLEAAVRQLGVQLMADLQGIQAEIAHLSEQQAAGSDAIAAQLTVIADEVSQINAETIKQEDLDALAAQIRQAAQVATDQAAQIRANSEQIAGIVPDAPPA